MPLNVRVWEGHFNLLEPDQEGIAVSISDETASMSIVLAPGDGSGLCTDDHWADVIQTAFGVWLRRILFSSQKLEVEAVYEWANSPLGEKMLEDAWRQYRIETLTVEIARLKSQVRNKERALSRLQEET